MPNTLASEAKTINAFALHITIESNVRNAQIRNSFVSVFMCLYVLVNTKSPYHTRYERFVSAIEASSVYLLTFLQSLCFGVLLSLPSFLRS
jgi:hypothetical protein